jgi:hypothetical protein
MGSSCRLRFWGARAVVQLSRKGQKLNMPVGNNYENIDPEWDNYSEDEQRSGSLSTGDQVAISRYYQQGITDPNQIAAALNYRVSARQIAEHLGLALASSGSQGASSGQTRGYDSSSSRQPSVPSTSRSNYYTSPTARSSTLPSQPSSSRQQASSSQTRPQAAFARDAAQRDPRARSGPDLDPHAYSRQPA